MSDLVPADDELTPIAPADDELVLLEPAPTQPLPMPEVSPPADNPLMGSDGIELAPLEDPRRLSNPYAGQRARYEEEQRQKEELIRSAFDFTKDEGLTDGQVNLRIAKHFGVREDLVALNREKWAKEYAKSNADPKAWMRDFPLSARLVLEHPERANEVVNNKEVNVILQAINKAEDFLTDISEPVNAAANALGLQSDETYAGVKQDVAKQQAGRTGRDAPKPTVEAADAEAARIREGGTLAMVAQRAREGKAALKVSKLYSDLLFARTRKLPTYWIESDIQRAKMEATPKYLNESPLQQALGEAVETAMSTVDVATNAVKKGGAGAAVGLAIGAGAALLARNPAGIGPAAVGTAQMLGKAGGLYGAAEGSFRLELGSSYEELSQTKTSTGELLTDEEARGGAVIAALVKTGIELAELSVILKAMGPAGQALRTGGLQAVKEALATNPGFRVHAKRALAAWAANAFEEVGQDAVDQATLFTTKSMHEGRIEPGPVFNVERLKENFAAGLLGGTLFGAGGLAFTAAQHAMFESRQERGGVQAENLMKLAAHPSAPGMAEEMAAVIKAKTAEQGNDVTHVFVDPKAILRFFQNDQEKADEKMVEMLGEKGPEQLAGALATDRTLGFELGALLGKAGPEFAKFLEKDAATQATHLTAAQMEAKKKEIEDWAKKLAAGEEKSETLERFDVLEAQLAATGTHTPSEAKAVMQPLREVFTTFAKKFGKTAEDLFRDVRLKVDDGTATLEILRKQANVSERLSKELHDGLPAEEKARRLYIDPVTGLRTRRAFDETARTEGRQVAVVTSPDIKALNDDVEGGHDTANELLRVIGAAVGEVDPNAARSGTNFVFEVDSQEHFGLVLERLRKALPDPALRLEGGLGAKLDDAFGALDANVEEQRRTEAVVDPETKKELKPAKKATLPARGTTDFDLKKLKGFKFPAGKATERLSPELVAKAEALGKADFFREAYQDKQVPGVLSATAWNNIPRKKHVASIDIKGLKDINNDFGKEVGDRLLKQFAQVVERNDGSDFDVAHLSGDEYAAQHDDPKKLQAWLDHVRVELAKNPLPVTLRTSEGTIEKKIRVKFRGAIGEKSYGAADRALNRAKAEERASEAARDAGGTDAGAGVGVREGAPGSEVVAFSGYERHGAPRQGFLEPDDVRAGELLARLAELDALAAAEEADQADDGSAGRGDEGAVAEDEAPDTGPTWYEQNPQDEASVAEARDVISRMKEPGRSWAAAEFEFILAGRKGTRPDDMGTTPEQRNRIMRQFLDAGFPDPDFRIDVASGQMRFERLKTKSAKKAAKKGKGKQAGAKKKLTIDERAQIIGQLKGLGPAGRAQTYNQFPTREESLRAAEALLVFLDYAREKGAKPVDATSNFDMATKRLQQHAAATPGGNIYHEGMNEQADRIDEAQAANERAGAVLGRDRVPEDFDDVLADSQREAARAVRDANGRPDYGAIDKIPPSKNLPGQKEIEDYLNKVNASANRLFQEPSAEQQKALDLAKRIEAALRQPGVTRVFATDESGNAKGFTDITREGIDQVFRIGLSKKADASTFLHESAHVFLELFAELADRADAPRSVIEDWQTTLKWLGVTSREGIKRDQHEKWAKAFEVYVAQGKYPADRLAGAFQRFRLWMMQVYKTLQNIGGEVNEDIRGVFDRMLATDAEIEATRQRMGLQALSQEALGMTPLEYAAHTDELLKATSHAAQVADFQVAKDQLRATEDWWKAGKAAAKQAASERFEKLPARIAQQLLAGKPAGDFLGIKEPLHRAAVVAMVGEKDAKKFKTAKDGIHPDEIAEMFEYGLGFATGRDMLQAVLRLPDKDTWVDFVSDEQMRQDHPGVLDERTRLRDLVGQGLHGKATKQWVLKEWRALNSRASLQPGELPPLEALQRAAEIMVAGYTAGQLLPRSAQVAERTAANNAAMAAARGNFAQAAIYKRQQLLNMYVHDAILEAKKEVDRVEAKGAQLAKLPARQRLGKASPFYRDASDLLLGTFGFAEPEPGVQNKTLDAALQEVEKLMAEDQTPVAFDRARLVERASTRGLRTWRELPIEDVRHIMKALENIEAGARNRSTVMLDDKRADKEEVLEGLRREAEVLKKRPDDPTPEARTVTQRIGHAWTALDGSLLKPETMARFLSGADDTTAFLKSTWFKAIVKPMQAAKVRELDLGREHLAPLVKHFETIPNAGKQMEKVDGRKLFPTHIDVEVPTRRFEILTMLLNMGNQGNIDRLTRGRNITETEVMNAAVAVGITKEEFDWVQQVWDTAEKLKPLAFDLEEKISGVRPDEVVARELVTPFGKLRGGYFPAVYSPVSAVGARQEAQLVEFKDPSMQRPSTMHNFLKSRVEDFSDVISLSPNSISRHFALVLHDVAFREAVQSVGGLLVHEDVRQTMRERMGAKYAEQLLQWVADVAQMRGAEGFDKSGGLMRLATALRGNLVTASLGYKIPNAMEDFTTNLLSAIPASDLKPQHLAAGLAEFYATGKNTRAFALERSGELRSRQRQMLRELQKQVKDLTASGIGRVLSTGPIGWYKDNAFAFAEAVEYATSTPIWLGAYRQAIAESKTETEAAEFADATIRQVLVSHNAVDLSGLMRDKSAIGYLTMFFGAFNHFYNQFRVLGHGYAEADTLKARAVKAGKMLGLATGVFLVGSAVRGHGKGEDEERWEWALRRLTLDGLMQMVPVLNVIATRASQALQDKPLPARNNSLYGAVDSVASALLKLGDPETSDTKRVKAFLDVLGPSTGIPTSGPRLVIDPMLEWALGPDLPN